ncbi:hypothetical protein [Bradyrhizobium sp. Leo121]|uniref:hypothetical protein n=1 Tax=Bradyrhizobium sp. Leo121 TaxID=1571195 RepID=UPI00102A4AED|nr:hypothetical protein [Bradyrhizobium sp. Leo121]
MIIAVAAEIVGSSFNSLAMVFRSPSSIFAEKFAENLSSSRTAQRPDLKDRSKPSRPGFP